jgi:hypothetical protein
MLTLLNHPRLLEGGKALDAYLKRKPTPTPDQVVEWLYLSTLSRRPTGDERAAARRYLAKSGSPERAYNGVLWMLVNRSEFLFVR